MAEAEEVQYPNNPVVAPAPVQVAPPAQVAPPTQEPQVPAAVPNEQRDVENAQPKNYEVMQLRCSSFVYEYKIELCRRLKLNRLVYQYISKFSISYLEFCLPNLYVN